MVSEVSMNDSNDKLTEEAAAETGTSAETQRAVANDAGTTVAISTGSDGGSDSSASHSGDDEDRELHVDLSKGIVGLGLE